MAGVTNLESNPFALDFDVSNSFFYTTSFDEGFEFGFEQPENDDPDCFFYGGGGDDGSFGNVVYTEESTNFVTDSFDSPEQLVEDGDLNWDFDSTGVEDDWGVELGFGSGVGLRVVDLNSESDSEEIEVNFLNRNNNDDDDDYQDAAFIDDVFGIRDDTDNNNENGREDFEWEQVSERVNLDESEALNGIINRIEEISVISASSENVDSGLDGDDVANIEWEILLAVNNMDRGFEFEGLVEEGVENVNAMLRVNNPGDYILPMDDYALFAQFVEDENSFKGSPPAAKHAVESLPMMVLKKEDVTENGIAVVVCAVCKDESVVGEKVTKMPCSHLYHGDCILPWLRIRNTCPVCRYELPTDDEDYERRKRSSRARGGATSGAATGNFELLP